jgi:hypothetical protein
MLSVSGAVSTLARIRSGMVVVGVIAVGPLSLQRMV